MRVIIAATALCLASAPALAQDEDRPAGPPPGVEGGPPGGPPGDMITVALGAAYGPDYAGSDDYRIIPGGVVRADLGDVTILNRGLRLYADVGFDIAENTSLSIGPILGIRPARTSSVQDEVVDRLPRRDLGVETGAFIGINKRDLLTGYDTLSFRLDAYRDIAGAHDDWIFSPAVDYSTPVSRTTFVSTGASLEFVGGKFADTYFGISPEEALLVPELGTYDPDGGLQSVSANLVVGQSLEGDLREGWAIVGAVIYSRLLGDFADSPLVATRGDPNQWFFAAGIGYTF